jgi:hypothetical protein
MKYKLSNLEKLTLITKSRKNNFKLKGEDR